MKNIIVCALCALTLAAGPAPCALALELTVGGQPVGIELETDGVTVAGFSELETEDGLRSPARDAGLCEGDRIVRVGDRSIGSAEELIAALDALDGAPAELSVVRGGRSETLVVQPQQNETGRWMLGLWLRDRSSGIGRHRDPAHQRRALRLRGL